MRRHPVELSSRLRLMGTAAGDMRAAIRTHLRTHFREDYAALLEARRLLEDRRAALLALIAPATRPRRP